MVYSPVGIFLIVYLPSASEVVPIRSSEIKITAPIN